MINKNRSKIILLVSTAFIFLLSFYVHISSAQTLGVPTGAEDPTQTGFRLIICDGPDLSNTSSNVKSHFNQSLSHEGGYIACDFNGLMLQAQHMINIMMILGVLAAIVLLTYGGGLYLTGSEGNISKAKVIFPKILWGFVIMIVAWFVVYQILVWIAPGSDAPSPNGTSPFTKLLGK